MKFIKKKPIIYVLSGKANSGKNKSASIISDIYYKKNKRTIVLAYASYLKEYAKNIIDWDGSEESKPRDFLQQIGVELIKDNINDRMLIERIIDDIKVYSYFFDVIVISDARFKEEITSIKDEFDNVKVIRINSDLENNLTDKQKEHITEIALDDYDLYDYKIDNNESVYKLKEKLEKIIDEEDFNG